MLLQSEGPKVYGEGPGFGGIIRAGEGSGLGEGAGARGDISTGVAAAGGKESPGGVELVHDELI